MNFLYLSGLTLKATIGESKSLSAWRSACSASVISLSALKSLSDFEDIPITGI